MRKRIIIILFKRALILIYSAVATFIKKSELYIILVCKMDTNLGLCVFVDKEMERNT